VRDDDDHIKRPTLSRTSATRSAGQLFRQMMPDGTLAGAAGETPWSDVVSRSVELGYRVIDDYVRQGERMARGMRDGGANPQAMAGDAQEVAARMMQYAAEMSGLWLQMFQVASGGMAAWGTPAPFGAGFPSAPFAPPMPPRSAPRPSEPPPPQPAADASDAVGATRVVVSVSSPCRTDVSLDLRSQAVGRAMVVQSLRAADGSKPKLTDVEIVAGAADEPVTLRIHVPTGQPPGVYNGMVIDEETGLPLGTVSLRVHPE